MSENSKVDATADDLAWARNVKSRAGRQVFSASAKAIVANELATAIRKQQLWRLDYLLSTPMGSLFAKPALPDPASAFDDAWQALGGNAEEISRRKFPGLIDNRRTAPLTAAVLAGFEAGAELLLAKGAPAFSTTPHATGYNGALGAAIFRSNKDMMSLLLKQPAVQKELAEKPAFRNYLLMTALGTDCADTLAHLCKLDPDMQEKGRAYGDMKASDFTLGEGIFAEKEKLKAKRAFEASQKPAVSKYGSHPPKYRPVQQP